MRCPVVKGTDSGRRRPSLEAGTGQRTAGSCGGLGRSTHHLHSINNS